MIVTQKTGTPGHYQRPPINVIMTAHNYYMFYVLGESKTMLRLVPIHRSILILLMLVLSSVAGTPTIQAGVTPQLIAAHASGMLVSPDSSTIIYIRPGNPDVLAELMRVPITGGTPLSLNSAIAVSDGLAIENVRVSANSQWVVYLAKQTLAVYTPALYSVPLAGGTPVLLSHPLPEPTHDAIVEFMLSPDSKQVIYITERDADPLAWDERRTLHTVPIDGSSPPVELNPGLTGSQRVATATITSDSARVIFTVAEHSYIDTIRTFYSASLSGGSRLRLDGPLERTMPYRVSPDGTYIIYSRGFPNTETFGLYQASVTGGTPVRKNTPEDEAIYAYDISPDSNNIVFAAGDPATGPARLFSIARGAASNPVALSAPLPHNGAVSVPIFTSDSKRTLFVASDGEIGREGLFSVPTASGPLSRLNAQPGPTTTLNRYRITNVMVSSDDAYVVYAANQLVPEGWPRIYGTPVDGTKPPAQVGELELLPGYCLESDIQITPDGDNVLYRALRKNAGGHFEKTYDLMMAPIRGGQSIKLNQSIGVALPYSLDCSTRSFVVSPNNSYILFRDELGQLYTVDISSVSLPPEPTPTPELPGIFLPLVRGKS